MNPIKTQQLYVSLGDKAYLFDAQALGRMPYVYHLQHQPMQFEQEFISYDYAELLRKQLSILYSALRWVHY